MFLNHKFKSAQEAWPLSKTSEISECNSKGIKKQKLSKLQIGVIELL